MEGGRTRCTFAKLAPLSAVYLSPVAHPSRKASKAVQVSADALGPGSEDAHSRSIAFARHLPVRSAEICYQVAGVESVSLPVRVFRLSTATKPAAYVRGALPDQ